MKIKAPSEAFMAAVRNWHEDPELNRLLGFGQGSIAKHTALSLLSHLYRDGKPDAELIAIWEGKEPVGYSVLDNIDTKNKNLEIHMTIAPPHQDKGLGAKALALISDSCFRNGMVRLTFSPFTFNKRAINMAKKVGYRVEAKLRMAAWTPDGFVDLLQMRLIEPEHGKLKKYLE